MGACTIVIDSIVVYIDTQHIGIDVSNIPVLPATILQDERARQADPEGSPQCQTVA